MNKEEVLLKLKSIRIERIDLSVLDDIDSLSSKALSSQLEGAKQAQRAAAAYQEANDAYARMDTLINKANQSAKELGATATIKQLASYSKTSNRNYKENQKKISTLKSF